MFAGERRWVWAPRAGGRTSRYALCEPVAAKLELGSRAAGEFAERIGLRVPIESLRAGRIALEAVLGPPVIGKGDLGRVHGLCRCDVHREEDSDGRSGSGQRGDGPGRLQFSASG